MNETKKKRFRFKHLNKKKLYVVGVSGGPDSMFLLDKMRKLGYDLLVAHVNYKKRDESWFDEKVVNDYCKRYNIKFFSTKVIYGKLRNFQSFARNFRYDFFSQICFENCFSSEKDVCIVVAHNLEDLIETYIIQKTRNSLVEFWGISFENIWKSKWGSFHVYRPILSFEKKYILKYLEVNKINYAIDITNKSEIYQRNVVRKELNYLPETRKNEILSDIKIENLKLSKSLEEFKLILKNIVFKDKVFLNEHWKKLDKEMKNRVIYFWLNNNSGDSFLLRKKKTVLEIVKQFDNSKNKKILFSFKNGFKIEKWNNSALIKKCL